jgi:hypothetical protein
MFDALHESGEAREVAERTRMEVALVGGARIADTPRIGPMHRVWLNAGEQAMREDAARVQSELDTLQKQKDAKVEQAQREEYARLKRRFG